MKKIIKEIKDKGIIQVTISDERWYIKTNGQGKDIFVPSVTWIASFFPKGIGFYKWLANTGWNESQAIKEAAGDKGSKVHLAIVDLLDKKEVKMNDQYINNSIGQKEELTSEEYECLMTFVSWFNKEKPEIVAREMVVFNNKDRYAGTVDLICKIKNELYVVDFKTSQSIWPEHEIQVSAYKHALPGPESFNLAILQIGYKRNKAGYKFTEVEDKFDLFLAAKFIWKAETEGIIPLKKDYPEKLCLNIGTNATPAKES